VRLLVTSEETVSRRVTAGVTLRTTASSPSTPHFTLNVLAERGGDTLIAEGWVRDKLCLVTIDTRVSVTIARLDIIAGQPEMKPSWPYVLQMMSRETIPILKETLVQLTLGWSAFQI
jgi:hypothetical protein